MDRNREARRASIVGSNGFKRRRHRTSSLRGSPDEDLGVELQESIRLRDRVRNDRDREREIDRERERGRYLRERDSRSKRRRAERLMINRDDIGGDETSEESVNDDADEDDEENTGGGVRLMPATVGPISNHHHHGHSSGFSQHQHDSSATNIITSNHHLQTRKTFPPSTSSSTSKVFKAGPVWKPGEEMIGVSVPRKARSACTKRSHDRISGSSDNIIAGGEQILLQASSSPVRHPLAPSPATPVSPSSSNASVRKKLKLNSGPKLKPPKVSSKTSSSNPEELEIEIAEVLYGLKTQSQSPSLKKEDSREINRSSSDTKSHVSPPISNSASANNLNLASNSSPLSAVAPKRKRPRQVLENSIYGARSTLVFAKLEMDQAPKSEISSSKLEKISGSTGENGFEMGGDLVNSQGQQVHLLELKAPDSIKIDSDFKSTAEESKNNADLVQQEEMASIKGKEMRTDDSGREDSTLTVTASAAVTIIKPSLMPSEAENQREEKFVIDLMPLVRSSPDKETKVDLAGSDQKPDPSIVDAELKSMMLEDKEEEQGKIGKVKLTNVTGEEIKGEKIAEEDELLKPFENKSRNLDLQLDLDKSERDGGNKLQHQVLKQPQMPLKVAKEEPATGKPGQLASSLPLPLSMAAWPGGLPPPMGYMASLQGVVSMDGSTVTPPPSQPPFSQPRPKRCATHFYIARNINHFQQFMKMNPFWQAAAGCTSLFGAKPGNMNAVTVTDLLGNNTVRGLNNNIHEKGQNLASNSSAGGKEKNSQSANSSDSAHRKQQVMLQQTLPPVAAPSNLVGPAFIFPLNQQQAAAAAAAAAASQRPVATKSHTAAIQASSNTSRSASASTPATTGGSSMSFNYPNMATNETQYLAILQNNAYPFPIPAVGAPPNYRGTPAQAMPMFNGPFYSSQMIHHSQLQHQQPIASQSPQLPQAPQNASASSGSSPSQKHLSAQQIRSPSCSTSVVAGSTNFPVQKPQSAQHIQQAHNQHISSTRSRLVDNEIGGEESPSTTDNRGSWASVNIYGQNFAMPIHPQNFALMTPTVLASAAASNVVPAGAVSNSEKKPPQQTQQQKSKGGVDPLPPHSFAMSFGTINGSNASPGIDIASMTQNHAVFQNFPEATRQNFQMVAAVAAAQAAAQKKNFRISEDVKSGGGDSVSTEAERKSSSGKFGIAQSIAFTRSDLADTPVSSIPVNSGFDSSARSLNVSTGSARSSRPGTVNSVGVGNVQNAHIQAQLQHQQMLQIKQQQQQQLLAGTRKAPATSNGNVYSDHMNSSSSISAKFPNPLSGFPQNIVQSNNSSAAQSPQWKNPTRTAASQASSPLASSTVSTLKSHSQHHPRAHSPMHTQISFGGNQKTQTSAQGQAPLNNQQAPSSPMMVSSPTTSSISKGSNGSPRTTTTAPSSNIMSQASSLSAQPIKNPASIPSQKSPSILGNPQIASSPSSVAKPHIQQLPPHQQQIPKTMQQAQLFFSNPFSQLQTTNPTSTGSTTSVPSGYYTQRKWPDQQNQSTQQLKNPSPTSTGALSLTSSVTSSTTATSDPAKAIVAATCNVKGGGFTSQGVLHAAQLAVQSTGTLLPVGFSYAHPVPAAIQTKHSEHKQSAGNDNLQQWQHEKK